MMTFQCRTAAGPPLTRTAPRACWKRCLRRPQCNARPRSALTSRRGFGIAGLRRVERRAPAGAEGAALHPGASGGGWLWYGRWGVNYIYGTWQVLRGLRALNLNMNEPWLLKARDWLESVQHEDGGWGERCNTYDDPVFKGQGPSTASQTAWAVMGLCTFDDPDRPSLRRGIEYLTLTQNAMAPGPSMRRPAPGSRRSST